MGRKPQPWQRKSTGTWHVQIDGKQVYLGKDKAAAEKKYHRLMVLGKAPTTVTVCQIVTDYWAWCKANLAETTCERRRVLLEEFGKFIKPKLKAEDLRAFHVQKWIDANRQAKVYKKQGDDFKVVVTDKPISPTTVGDRITLIKGMMSWAKRQGYIDSNPIADMPKPAPRIREEFLSSERWQEFLAHCADDGFRELIEFTLETGCRATEVMRFRVKHFDDDNRRIVLPASESKGRKRPRVIPLSPRAYELVDKPGIDREKLLTMPSLRERPLFVKDNGDAWTKSSLKGRFKVLKRKMKMPGLCLTVLRHSYAHYRLSSGQDALTVSKLMGHVDTRMLATRYGHLDANSAYMLEAAAAVPFPAATPATA